MKKVLIALFIAFPSIFFGQRFNGGILAGLSASQVDGDALAGFDKVGLQGGVFVNTGFTRHWGAQLEIKYVARGARKKVTTEDPDLYKLSLHYIDIPLLLTYNTHKKILLEAGIVPGYLFFVGIENNDGKVEKEFIPDYKKIDLGWLLGMRYKVNKSISLNLRYSYSLVSILNTEEENSQYSFVGNIFGYNKGDYNNFLTFGMYYEFNLR